jgi:hypothetical protein
MSGPIEVRWSAHDQAPAKDFDRWWTPQNEALAAAPRHHTLLFENDEVRVLTVTIALGVKEPFHAQRWLPIGPPHALENVGATPLRIVGVEIEHAR